MSQEQLLALNEKLAASPLDIGGDLAVQRPLFEQVYAIPEPLPEDAVVENVTLGGVPAVSIDLVSNPGRATILFFHGGGFAVGTAASSVQMALQLTRLTGMRVLSVDYRLAPEFPFPAAVTDGKRVFDALLAAGVEPGSSSIWGVSAGGAIALNLAVQTTQTPVSCVVLFSPWLDLTLTGESMTRKAAVDLILSREGLQPRVLDYIGDGDPADPAASPLFADLRGLPPILLQVGSAEVLLDDSVRLAAAASNANVPVILEVAPHAPHVFQSAAALYDEGADALGRACEFASRNTPSH